MVTFSLCFPVTINARRKRTVKRRPARRYRRKSMKLRPDGMHKEKVTIERDLWSNGAAGSRTSAWHGIQWL